MAYNPQPQHHDWALTILHNHRHRLAPDEIDDLNALAGAGIGGTELPDAIGERAWRIVERIKCEVAAERGIHPSMLRPGRSAGQKGA